MFFLITSDMYSHVHAPNCMCTLMSSCGHCQDGFDYDVPALSSYDVDGKKKKKKRKDHEQVRGADGGGDRVKKKKLKVKDGK